jgi:CRISPR-associated endonuclease/helicase Cas3
MEFNNPPVNSFIAHVRKSDGCKQSVTEHSVSVGHQTQQLALKINLPSLGALQGLMHDFGKFSLAFKSYLESATGGLDPDLDGDWVDAKRLKGKIDHSTAGAQWVYQTLKNSRGDGRFGKRDELCAQILALCIASHHSGLIDCIDADGNFNFKKRIEKDDAMTHLSECLRNADAEVLEKANALCTPALVNELWLVVDRILCGTEGSPKVSDKVQEFQLGMLTRFLLSTLIDADRMDSADFENPQNIALRTQGVPDWSIAIERLERHLQAKAGRALHEQSAIDAIRRKISDKCRLRADDIKGIYTLSVPTGGGKTLASLRYALHHARQHGLDRIVYIIPYTSIIEQNAKEVRDILEEAGDVKSWVLEHHSNLEPDQQTWQSKLYIENWDSPIIFTTMVQFLEACYAGGTQSARRFHQLGKAVLVFDEIQTLPIKCVHMFCNTLNFLVQHAQTTALLCTATQPVLDRVPQPEYGELNLSENHELAGDLEELNGMFKSLDRVEVINLCETQGWSLERVRDFVLEQFHETQSTLVIVNTKAWAQKLYMACQEAGVEQEALFHLSTNQCAAHRKALLNGPCGIKRRLRWGRAVLCISTQLIEAGVDVSFGSVVRFLAGLDSIAQAAGRCNRHGERKDANGLPLKGKVYVVKPDKETTEMLTEIEEGKEKAETVFRYVGSKKLPENVLSPEVISHYFQLFFYDRKDAMTYPLEDGTGRNLLSMLGDNRKGQGGNGGRNYRDEHRGRDKLLMQSFMEAGKAFKAIDSQTHAVIVPYGEAVSLIAKLQNLDPKYPEFYKSLRQAQKFTVSVFANGWRRLCEAGAVVSIGDTEIYYLLEQHYDKAFGLRVPGSGPLVF